MYIGEHGSCHKIGVIATGGIKKGECLARIPREAILSCANSTVAGIVKSDKELRAVTSSWIPLLIALSAEYSLKVSTAAVFIVVHLCTAPVLSVVHSCAIAMKTLYSAL